MLLDAEGHPWLIEINDHPSVRIDAQIDSPAVLQAASASAPAQAAAQCRDAPSPAAPSPTSRGRAREVGLVVPSAVDEAIKVPMVRDALRIVAALHSLHVGDDKVEDDCAPPPSSAPPSSAPPPSAPDAAASPPAASNPLLGGLLSSPPPDLPPPPAAPPPPPRPPASSPARAAGAHGTPVKGGAFGTCYVEIASDKSESHHLQLLARLRGPRSSNRIEGDPFCSALLRAPLLCPALLLLSPHNVARLACPKFGLPTPAGAADLFEQHTPSADLFDSTWGEVRTGDARETSGSGPRWKPSTWAAFLKSASLAGGHRASAVAAGLAGPDAELLFTSVCGKGGSMDVLDFAEALARVAARIYPRDEGASPAELIERLLARSFTGSHGSCVAPASARATTAARAQSVAKAAAIAAARRH